MKYCWCSEIHEVMVLWSTLLFKKSLHVRTWGELFKHLRAWGGLFKPNHLFEVSARCVNTRARWFRSARHGHMKIRCKITNPQSKSETSRCSQHFWCTTCVVIKIVLNFSNYSECYQTCVEVTIPCCGRLTTRVLQTFPEQAWYVSQHNIWIVRLAEKESQKHILLNEGSISIPSMCSEKLGKISFGKIFV